MNEFIHSMNKNNTKVISSDSDRKGSRKGDRDIVKELIELAKELPNGKGKDVIVGLGVGIWRGDEPEEEEFFRIIDSKY